MNMSIIALSYEEKMERLKYGTSASIALCGFMLRVQNWSREKPCIGPIIATSEFKCVLSFVSF